MLYSSSQSPRVRRLYFTRLYEGHPDQGELVCGTADAPVSRPALTVLGHRQTTF